jgi:hypothetical protein
MIKFDPPPPPSSPPSLKNGDFHTVYSIIKLSILSKYVQLPAIKTRLAKLLNV